MAVHRAISASDSCNACRSSILNIFTSISGFQFRPVPLIGVVRGLRQSQGSVNINRVRAFTRSSRHGSGLPEETSEPRQILEDDALKSNTERNSNNLTADNERNEQLPWYLQVQAPRQVASPFLARQNIPDLPNDSPSLLQPLLEHISIDLGIDDLTILDLRKIDPPPALGANLLMVLGTARSEKHLHVSADRLCRWLRTSHKLNPFADGLLGRNELKLKMRRKAKRTKLLSSVGASDRENSDDGIRTGWVCVNVGKLEDGTSTTETVGEKYGIVGFGVHTKGVRVVVQMLTEEKRAEIDLEGLWRGIANRRAQQDVQNDAYPTEASQSVASSLLLHDQDKQATKLASAKLAQFVPLVDKTQSSQRRAFHSKARKDVLEHVIHFEQQYNDPEMPSIEPSAPDTYGASLQQGFWTIRPSVDTSCQDVAHQRLAGSTRHGNDSEFANVEQALTLRDLLSHLKRLPKGDALEALGKSSEDFTSTSFLTSFYEAIPSFPSSVHLGCKLEMLCYAIELGHSGYSKSSLLKVFLNMLLSGIVPSESAMYLTFQTLLGSEGASASDMNGQRISKADIDMAMTVLQHMNSCGYDIVTEDIFLMLHEAIVLATRAQEKSCSEGTIGRAVAENQNGSSSTRGEHVRIAQRRLLDIMEAFNVFFTKDESWIRILHLYAMQGHWLEFWNTWEEKANRFEPRSGALYEFVFLTIAATGNQRECMRTLRALLLEMEKERPRVFLKGRVARAVQECLLVADPWVADDAKSGSSANGEWLRIWRRCEQGLEDSITHDEMGR